VSGPKPPPPELEDYDDDPDEDLIVDEPENPDEIEDDNEEGPRENEIDFALSAFNEQLVLEPAREKAGASNLRQIPRMARTS
jgi:hypothetical protein